MEAIRQRRAAAKSARAQALCETLASGGLGDPQRGRVIAHYGLNVAVLPEGERDHHAILRCAVRETLDSEPVCGDWVVWRASGAAQGVIEAVEARRTVLRRPGSHGKLLTMAANLDQLLITSAAPLFNPFLLDRYLVACSMAEIEPIICVNKIDLLDDEQSLQDLLELLAPYKAMKIPIILLSALEGLGVELLRNHLRHRCSAFVGPSGVGKSSLAAQWIHDEPIRVAETNPTTGKGRHTTTVARLYPLTDSQYDMGSIIDSPGVRAFGFHDARPEEIIDHFPDIVPWSRGCRFNDCRHLEEPDCAVRRAVEEGHLDPYRLESLHRIIDSLEEPE
ncbi:putative ribosome small subunit-dependent GTPase A [Magnetofaba australis IT-1]|uniref:Small ribosomal subunit biogenesis GTPase RsgA n=1 Tax=Magnetofaba australis IT-1 TaxID=1434232 RepID=A0A1Y2K965_9PROT|nr:putative ribosome small subunit-dependent GTPase A [Magnetofaba australis IT-1]